MKNSEIIIYQTEDGQTKIDVKFNEDSVWLTQGQMTELFQTTKQNISLHINNAFNEGELDELSVVKEYLTTASDGKNYKTKFFNLDVIISVGYRVKSLRGTQFRIWATKRLNEYMIKGFTMNDELLKKAGGGQYFDELLERIRDIRSSEKVFWRKVLDIIATSIDYDADKLPEHFFDYIQNKMHWAAHGHTAAEILMLRADASKPNMGLVAIKGKKPQKSDINIAKNYLDENELSQLNLLVSSFLDIAELQARRGVKMKMADWMDTLDSFLKMSRSDILSGAGKISKEIAQKKAELEYKKFKKLTDDELSAIENRYIKYLGDAENIIKRKK